MVHDTSIASYPGSPLKLVQSFMFVCKPVLMHDMYAQTSVIAQEGELEYEAMVHPYTCSLIMLFLRTDVYMYA